MSSVRSRDDGVTLLSVMLAMVVLTGLVIALTTMVLGQTSFSRTSRDREGAVHAAEAGAEGVIAQVAATPTYATTTHAACPGSSTYHCLPDGLTDAEQRTWAVGQYDAAKAAGAVVPVPAGTAYGIRPVRAGTTNPLDVVFGIGQIGAAGGEVRVVRVRLDAATLIPLSRALTVQGSVAVVNGAGVVGGVHTNGQLTVVESTVGTPITCGGSTCPGGSAGTPSILPDVRARAYYAQGSGQADAWYDLCDGTIRRWSPAGPCTGPLAPAPGWAWAAAYRRWTHAGGTGLTGVYYAHQASVRVSGGGQGTATLLASRDPAGNDPLQGNVWVDDGAVLTPYLPGVGVIGDRDVCICNGGGVGRVGSPAQPAAVVAGEQFYVWESTVVGAALALDNVWWGGPAETPNSPSQAGPGSPYGVAWDYITKCSVPNCVWQARVEAGAVTLLDASRPGVSGWQEL